MTKKDFIVIADGLIEARKMNGMTDLAVMKTAIAVAKKLKEHYPRFDDARFYAYIEERI
jgi:hypothetical protein